MTVRQELRKRAAESTIAAVERSGREAVEDALTNFGVEQVSDLRYEQVPEYIDLVEILPAKPKVAQLPVLFELGDEVARKVGPNTTGPVGVVVGYDVRYIVRVPGGSSPQWGYRGEALRKVTELVAQAPAVPYSRG